MNWQPLLDAGPIIYGHAVAAFLAIFVGAVQFALPKGTPLHRGIGYCWMALISAVAISSFFIHTIKMLGPFSLIHLLSVFTLYSVYEAIASARAGNIAQHKRTMIRLFVLALILTGAFTLLPGRIMHAVFFGGT